MPWVLYMPSAQGPRRTGIVTENSSVNNATNITHFIKSLLNSIAGKQIWFLNFVDLTNLLQLGISEPFCVVIYLINSGQSCKAFYFWWRTSNTAHENDQIKVSKKIIYFRGKVGGLASKLSTKRLFKFDKEWLKNGLKTLFLLFNI